MDRCAQIKDRGDVGREYFVRRPSRQSFGFRVAASSGPIPKAPGSAGGYLPGLLAQFKSDWPPGFLLPDHCAIRRVPAGGDILDPDGDEITAAKLAVDCQIEPGEVASAAFNLGQRGLRSRLTGECI